MSIIKFQPSSTNEKGVSFSDFFYVEIQQDSTDFAVMKAAFSATQGAGQPDIIENQSRITCRVSSRTILALHATGFDWDIDASKQALTILVKLIRKATYADIESA